MSDNSQAAQGEQVAASQAVSVTAEAEKVNNPEAVLNKNRELLAEIKAAKEKLTAYEVEQEKQRQDKMAEDGKLKELIEEKEKEIERLRQAELKAVKYDDFFKTQLDEAMGKLDDIQKKLIEGYNGDVSEKLQIAKSLINEAPKPAIAAGRAGGAPSVELDPSKYSTAELFKMKHENPQLFKQIVGG